MATWEDEVVYNQLWLDTSNPAMYVLKKYDSLQQKWVPSTATAPEDLGTYSAETIDTKIANIQQSGTTDNRPVDAFVGMYFFDTTLGKPIYCQSLGSPNIWVDSTGAIV